MTCEGCGNPRALRQFIRWETEKDENQSVIRSTKIEVCDQCSRESLRPQFARDPDGNKVSVPLSEHGRFSYATGTPILSSHQYANELHKHNLSLKET